MAEPIILDDSFITAANNLDLSKDGAFFVGVDDAQVSYFAQVQGGNIVGYECKDATGNVIPSFLITNMSTVSSSQSNVPLTIQAGTGAAGDGGTCYCCHNTGAGGFSCHPIKCPQ